MDNLRKAAEMALEALDTLPAGTSYKTHNAASALRKALEQPQTPNDLLRQSERESWRYAKECEAEVKRLRKARELLAWCAVEMRYAGWEHRVPDNHGRADVLEAVEEYLK